MVGENKTSRHKQIIARQIIKLLHMLNVLRICCASKHHVHFCIKLPGLFSIYLIFICILFQHQCPKDKLLYLVLSIPNWSLCGLASPPLLTRLGFYWFSFLAENINWIYKTAATLIKKLKMSIFFCCLDCTGRFEFQSWYVFTLEAKLLMCFDTKLGFYRGLEIYQFYKNIFIIK